MDVHASSDSEGLCQNDEQVGKEQAERCPAGPGAGEREAARVWPSGGPTRSRPGRRGRPGGLGGERAAEVGEDDLHGERVLDGSEDAQPATTMGTGEDIEGEQRRGAV